MAIRDTTKEAIYLSNMIKWLEKERKLEIIPPRVTPLAVILDSDVAIKLAENPEFHKRSKYIDIVYYFTRECIKEKKIKLAFVRSVDQLADGFTKGLNAYKHNAFVEGLNLKAK